jgi:hypothetical protein
MCKTTAKQNLLDKLHLRKRQKGRTCAGISAQSNGQRSFRSTWTTCLFVSKNEQQRTTHVEQVPFAAKHAIMHLEALLFEHQNPSCAKKALTFLPNPLESLSTSLHVVAKRRAATFARHYRLIDTQHPSSSNILDDD